ncbi:MAG TPA: hypothetical protein VMF59_10845 [Bacteroidota bacterium]|nr:hypothetical protein [Bacteroidota bacterium]
MNGRDSGFMRLLPSLQNNEEYFEMLASEDHPGRRIVRMALLFTGLTFFYGVIMGCYSGFLQALTAGVKVPVMFFLSLLVCFPAFFLIQFILGSRMKLLQMSAVILAGFVLAGAIMVSFTPIIVFFVLTGGNYHFLQLLHVGVFVVAGGFGMKMIVDALKYSCEQKNVYPQTGVVVFRFWVVILAFVAVQLAWNLRPFLAKRDEPYALFRNYEGNFYTAVIYSFQQLIGPPERIGDARRPPVERVPSGDTSAWPR